LNLTSPVPDILGRIVERKGEELRQNAVPLRELEERAEEATLVRRPFVRALRQSKPAIIAEIKQASPSKGRIVEHYAPAHIAMAYQEGGAAALSVLTDRDFFQGSLDHMEQARHAVKLPALRKDFTTSKYHVVEAAAHRADAILLIAAILSEKELRQFRELAAQYLMAALVEVHDGDELNKALDSGAVLIGVNNRDLRTFEVRLETSLDLAPLIPSNVLRVAESGINSCDHVRLLTDAGFHAFLVGEHLMRAPDPVAALRELQCS
jgi:indole-3-glycerol phosphate synthase